MTKDCSNCGNTNCTPGSWYTAEDCGTDHILWKPKVKQPPVDNLVPLSDEELNILTNLLFWERVNCLRNNPTIPKEMQELYEKLLEARYGSYSS